MRPERLDAVESRAADYSLDLLELEAEFAEEEDLLEREQLIFFVISVLVLAHPRGFEQSNLVVEVQRSHADAGELRELFYRVGHFSILPETKDRASRNVRVKAFYSVNFIRPASMDLDTRNELGRSAISIAPLRALHKFAAIRGLGMPGIPARAENFRFEAAAAFSTTHCRRSCTAAATTLRRFI